MGAFIGVFAALLQHWGNPGNMGVACFERGIAGALGLHRAGLTSGPRSSASSWAHSSSPTLYPGPSGPASPRALAAIGIKTPRAARANRLADLLADPGPATQGSEIIRRIPFALEEALREDERSPG